MTEKQKTTNPFADIESVASDSVLESKSETTKNYDSERQQSKDWFKARLGNFTASGMLSLMANGRGTKWGAKAITYINKLAIERTLTEEGIELYVEQQMMKEFLQTKWGNKYESFARELAEKRIGLLATVSFRRNEMFENFGGSADAVTIDGGAPVEIKCPFDVMVHQENLMLDDISKDHDYYPQIQSHIMNFNSDKCYFVSYDPRRDEKHRIVIHSVIRDDAFIKEMAERIAQAEEAIKSGENIENYLKTKFNK